MANNIKRIQLTELEQQELEKGSKSGGTFSFRCHIILLKSKGYSSLEIGNILNCTNQVIDRWVNRYLESGISGLNTKKGQGRPKILDNEADMEKIKEKIKDERQRLKNILEELGQELNKNFSLITLKRFLKKTAFCGEE